MFLTSCATPGSPTGGPKDTQAPKVLMRSPEQEATGVHTKKFKLIFDEFVQLQNPAQNVLISPPSDNFPEVQVKKNIIEITFKDSLLPNTTYALQFGDNIKDLNESNALSNFSWVFSTGISLDSIEISGRVKTEDAKEIPENTWAVLYTNLEDSAFITQRPYYFSKVDKSGGFKIKYLKPCKYKLYLLEDKNRNYYYDLPTEKIGFLDSIVILDSSLVINGLTLFEPEAEKQYIADVSTSLQSGQWHIYFSKPIPENQYWSIRCLQDTVKYFSRVQEDRQTIITWIKVSENPPPMLYWEVSLDNVVLDTISVNTKEVVIKPVPAVKQFGTNVPTAKESAPVKQVLHIAQRDTIQLNLPFPVSAISPEEIQLGDTTKTDTMLWIGVGADSLSLLICAGIAPGNYTLIIPPTTITDYTGKNKDTLQFQVQVLDVQKLGKLSIKMNLSSDNQCVVSVVNDAQKIVFHAIMQPKDRTLQIELDRQLPGKYRVEVIEDQDRNGLFTKGNYYSRRQPERRFLSSPIELKAGWEQETSIDVIF